MIGLFYFVFQFRKRKIQEELEKLKTIHLERERIIKDLHDELGGSINSIQIISSLILNNNLAIEKTIESVVKITEISKSVSQQINMVIWSLDTQKDTLINLIEYIKQYCIQFLEPTNIKLIISNDYDNKNISVSGFYRKNIFLTVKEIINNCAKHSKATKVNLSIITKNDELIISIHDNGVGFHNINPFGNGLTNIEKRIEDINGKLNIEFDNGTNVWFIVPTSNYTILL
jgi:signal transduction histidine kinase